MHHKIEAREFARRAPAEERPDVILVTMPTLALARAVTTFGAERGIPVVLDVRDCWPDHYLVFLPALLRPFARPLLFLQYRELRRTLQGASGVTTVSNAYLEWAHRNGRTADSRTDRVFPIGYEWRDANSTNPQFSSLLERNGLKRDDFIVLFAGTFNTSFELETVIRTAERVHRAGLSKVKFLFVGAGPYGKRLKDSAVGVPNVTFLDWIQDQQELRNVLTSATVGLCPYREKGSISLPNKPFEFMAAGKPLLSSLTGELWELIESEKIGLNYRSSSSDLLFAVVKRLVENPQEVATMAANARQLFEAKFEAGKIYPAFSKFLEEISMEKTFSCT
jgi:glycosyltransferase involved in cell wall biosynthesis